jgi:hypothetical protein
MWVLNFLLIRLGPFNLFDENVQIDVDSNKGKTNAPDVPRQLKPFLRQIKRP